MRYRRATGSDANRDRGADTVLELSIGVPHHFVHIFGVNKKKNRNGARVHIRCGMFLFLCLHECVFTFPTRDAIVGATTSFYKKNNSKLIKTVRVF